MSSNSLFFALSRLFPAKAHGTQDNEGLRATELGNHGLGVRSFWSKVDGFTVLPNFVHNTFGSIFLDI